MGEMADLLNEQHGYPNEDGLPEPEDYLDLSDGELKKLTSGTRDPKLMSIRRCSYPLTVKQRYCLAVWLANNDSKMNR